MSDLDRFADVLDTTAWEFREKPISVRNVLVHSVIFVLGVYLIHQLYSYLFFDVFLVRVRDQIIKEIARQTKDTVIDYIKKFAKEKMDQIFKETL